MRKSLIVIASALILAVAAATHDRLRYDSTVFTDVRITGGQRTAQVEYPPCVKGVREDRCIQLYERGVRRSYQRWLAQNGRGGQQVASAQGAGRRAYRACRGRGDDRCQQRASVRRASRSARPARVQQAQRRAIRRAQPARPVRAVARTTVRPQVQAVPRVQQRQRPGTRPSAPRGTPGI
jgi:hypothetical protein